jgi:hypothetical protein
MQGIKRIIGGSIIVAAGVLGLSLSASASTPGCIDNGFCGNQVNYHDGLVFDVFHQAEKSNTPVIAYSNSGSDKATDFINYHPTSGPGANDASVKAFEYAPDGIPSALCLSDPGPGFGTADKIVLRPCNNSKFQTWRPTESTVHSGYFAWSNLSSNQYITDNGLRGQLTDVKDGSVGSPTNNKFNGRHDQLWQFVQQPVVTAAYGPLGGLHPCTATSLTCQGDSVPVVPHWF